MSASETVIRQVTENVWIFSRPFARKGFLPWGGRSTAIKLQNGDVWVLASTHLDTETQSKLNEIGPVKYLCAPDAIHHLFLAEYKHAFPEAKVIGVEALIEKKKGVLTFDGAYGKDAPDTKYGFEPEIIACYFSGFENKDVAFFHAASKTLITADLIFNLPANEQYSKSSKSAYFPLVSLLNPYGWAHKKLVWGLGTDKAAMKQDAITVAGWDFTRIIPCHGDVVETDGNRAWKEAYAPYLKA